MIAPATRRREKVLTAEEWRQMLDRFPDRAFRNSLIALSKSGARPGVVRKVEARHVELRLGVWVLEGKRSKRTRWRGAY